MGGSAGQEWTVWMARACLASLSWLWEGLPGALCPTAPAFPMRTGGQEKGGQLCTALHTGQCEAEWVAHVILLGMVHRSRDPPWHGLGEPGFGGVALDPEQRVRHHRVSARQAAVQEPPSVHGNHVGTCYVPLPKPLGSLGVGLWRFRVFLWTCVSPEPTRPFLHCTPLCAWSAYIVPSSSSHPGEASTPPTRSDL